MDHDSLLVWVDSDPAVDPARAGSLCRRHADALTPPRGWTLDDRRDPVPRLLRVPENPTPPDLTPRGGVSRRKRKRVETVDIPSLFAEIAATATGEDSADADSGRHGAPAAADVVEQDADRSTVPVPGPTPVGTGDPDPDETKAIAWSPMLGNGEAPIPEGRLLGRAFGRRR
jgi:hypothetical protein